MNKYAPLAVLVSIACVGCASTHNGGLFSSVRPGPTNFNQELSLARLSERQNKTESAERIYHSILKHQPDNVVANHRLGVMSAKRGLHDEATKYFQTAEAAGLRSAEFYNDYGYLHYLQNETETAEQYFQKSLAVDASYRSTHNNLGLILGESQRYDESLKHFLLAVDEGEAYANLAFIQSQMGDLETAERNYHRALELDPELKRAAQALVQIASRRGTVKPVDRIPGNQEKQSADRVAKNLRQAETDVVAASVNEAIAAKPTAPTEQAIATLSSDAVAPASFMTEKSSAAASIETQQQVADAGQASLETKVESSMTSKSGLHYPQIMSLPPSLQTSHIRRSLNANPNAASRLGFAENTLRDTPRSE